MNTLDMTGAAVAKFHDPGARSRLEWGVLAGWSRADVAICSPSSLHLVEVKGPTDTLKRLRADPASGTANPGQIDLYGRVASRCSLVCCPRHLDELMKVLPAWWGVEVARAPDRLETLREASNVPTNDPRDLLSSLHVGELRALLAGLKGVGRLPKFHLVAAALERFAFAGQHDLATIRAAVYPVLFERPVDVGGFRA